MSEKRNHQAEIDHRFAADLANVIFVLITVGILGVGYKMIEFALATGFNFIGSISCLFGFPVIIVGIIFLGSFIYHINTGEWKK